MSMSGMNMGSMAMMSMMNMVPPDGMQSDVGWFWNAYVNFCTLMFGWLLFYSLTSLSIEKKMELLE